MINSSGVFEIRKGQKRKLSLRIESFGDEKLVLEGDFYKPSKKGSPFHGGESFSLRFRNTSGKKD